MIFAKTLFEDAPAMLAEIADDVLERCTAESRGVSFMVMNFSKHACEKLNLPLAVTAYPVEHTDGQTLAIMGQVCSFISNQ